MPNLTSHQQAALDIQNHISLTANAGSGKTFVLSMRYLEIAISENIALRNIAAITFTDKAAGELYNKIVKQVDEKIKSSTEPALIKKLESIRRQLVSANISTIHSFCINVLKEFPVEAGLDANFIPVDERTSGELIELAVEDIIKSSLDNPEINEELKYLVRIYASKSLFSKDIVSLIKNRKNILSLEKEIYSKTEKEISEYFYNSFLSLFTRMFPFDKNEFIKHIEAINETVLEGKQDNLKALELRLLIDKLKGRESTAEIIRALTDINKSLCTNKGNVYSQGYLSKKLRPLVENSCIYIENYFKGFPSTDLENHEEIEAELASFGKKILHFFNLALDNYEEKKREGGYLDYEDILLYTQRILEIDEVRRELSEKFNYIMIDEYQDTNELQYQIFLPILDYLKKGNLFVVGDEKQSIYMFRDAELEIFNRTKNDIRNEDPRNKLLKLPDSFRMSSNLCLFTNYIFRNLFRNPKSLYNEVEHSDLVCARSETISGKVEILLAGNESEDNELAEPDLIARRILKLVQEENFNWNDIAILCRKRKSFLQLEKVLSGYDIPFSIMGGKGFYQRQMVYDISNYFSFLLDSNNDGTLAGILRSPFFSLSDAEIFEISLKKGKSLWSKLKCIAENENKFTEVVQSLGEMLRLSATMDIVSLLRKILMDSDYLAVIASRQDGEQELANINKLVNLTINFNARGFNTIYDYIDFLKDSIEDVEDEAQAVVSDDSDSVKIMTYHQAKGLEFPAVFLFKCNETSNNIVSKSKAVTINKDFGIFTKLPLNNNYFGEYKTAPIISLSNLLANKKNIAELKRLFYVGVTRAKDYLFLSMEKKKTYPEGTFSYLLGEGLNEDYKKEKVTISSELEFLIPDGENFSNKKRTLSLDIPVITELPGIKNSISEKKEYFPKMLLSSPIQDLPEGEIISATKVAVYMQCPLKYKLTYELGYLPLYTDYKNHFKEKKKPVYEFNSAEDEILPAADAGEKTKIKNLSAVKGSVIHKALQMEIASQDLEEFISLEIKNRLSVFEYDSSAAILNESITRDLNTFYNSDIYKELKKYRQARNEFEIYVREKDYYLYGIIDKLIIDKDRVIIADYKTDDITENEITERAEIYFNQLRFYSYIVSRFLENINNFELRLVFLKHPGLPVVRIVKRHEMEGIGTAIFNMVNNIRNNIFERNTRHCTKCNYSLNYNRCIVNGN